MYRSNLIALTQMADDRNVFPWLIVAEKNNSGIGITLRHGGVWSSEKRKYAHFRVNIFEFVLSFERVIYARIKLLSQA